MKYGKKVKCAFGLIWIALVLLLFNELRENKNSKISSETAINKQIDDFSIEINDIEKFLNGEIIGIVYFGRDTCNFCTAFNSILAECYKDVANLEIYKFDTDKWRSDERYDSILEKYNVQRVPTLVKINENKEVCVFSTEKDTDEEIMKELLKFLNNSIY